MDIEIAIRRRLEDWGFSVEKIPTSSEKTPDFLVRDDRSTYLFEVKTRGDDPEETNERNEVLNQGQIYHEHKPIVRKNTVAGIIRDASEQLRGYGEATWLRIAWLCGIERAQIAKREQFKRALYGQTQIYDLDGDNHHRPCYFFGNSDFFRYSDALDAAIVSTVSEATLCLNPHSSRFKELQESKLVTKFGSAVCDPMAEEAAGEAYIVDSSMDRTNEDEVLEFLRNKYGAPKLNKIDLGWHSGTMLEPDDA